MPATSSRRKARPAQKTAARRLGSQAYWIAPVAIGATVITGVLLTHLESGAQVAGILAVPIAVAGVIVAALALPGPGRETDPRDDRRRMPRWLPSLVTLVLTAGGVFATGRLEAPGRILSGDLRIGIGGEVPGWSSPTSGSRGISGYAGYEVDLIDFLRQKYGFNPVLVSAPPALQYKYLVDGTVDILVANFEITSSRSRSLLFAGPYFRDRYGLFTSVAKKPRPGGRDLTVCRAYEREAVDRRFGDATHELNIKLVYEDSNQDCITRFLDAADPVDSVAMNQAILLSLLAPRGFDVKKLRLTRLIDSAVTYGVGFRGAELAECRAIAHDLGLWLSSGSATSMRDNLAFLIDDKDAPAEIAFDTAPFYSNETTCAH